MANLFSITAPLMIRLASGERRVIAERFRHPEGLLFFDLYWHLLPPGAAFHLLKGTIVGEGPWRIGGAVVQVLGCPGTEPGLAHAFAEWQAYRQRADGEYPTPEQIIAIARLHGAIPAVGSTKSR